MRVLDWLIDLTRSISRVSIWVVGGFLIFTVFLIGGEVVSRKLGSAWIHGASEVGGYMLAACSSWAYSYTLFHRANIRFDAIYANVGPKLRAWLDLLSLLCLGAFALVVAYYAAGVMRTSYQLNSHSVSGLTLPLWIPQAVWFAGLAFFFFSLLLLVLRVVVALAQGDYGKIFELAGLGSEIEGPESGVLEQVER